MRYFYYPGCSLEGTAVEYDTSTRSILEKLDAELVELGDWTCCGASAGDAVSYLLSMVLPARNLALAEKSGIGADFLVPCSACYLNLRKVNEHVMRDEGLLHTINVVLGEEGLSYSRGISVRHLLDVLANDIGPGKISSCVTTRLTGVTVAPYYGCQVLRPYPMGDDPEQPTSMEPLIKALGAAVFPWASGARCCGAGLMTTKKEVALELVGGLLESALGADCIATVCPMCQMNLESFQKKVSRARGRNLSTSIVYLPQLMGLAFGLSEESLKLDYNFAITAPFKEKLHCLAPII